MVRMSSREYEAYVLHVVDGDTYDLRFILKRQADLGFRVIDGAKFLDTRVRLRGIDTPEIYGVPKGSAEWVRGMASSEFVKSILVPSEQTNLLVDVVTHKTGKYGRYVVDITLPAPDGRDLATTLVKSGHAVWKNYD